MTPATFKKYKELAQDLEQTTLLPSRKVNHSLHHLKNAYHKTIMGKLSSVAKDKAYQFNVELEYIEPEINMFKDRNGVWHEVDHNDGGYWYVTVTRRLVVQFKTVYNGDPWNDTKQVKIDHHFKFNNVVELLSGTEETVEFLEGFSLQNDQKIILQES